MKDKDFQREDYLRCSYIIESLYFSVVQFTTPELGDFLPLESRKFFKGLETFLSPFMVALFVITFCKKLMAR